MKHSDLLKVRPPKRAVTGDIARAKVRKRREAGLCGACGQDPCKCKRPRRKQKFATRQTPDMPRKG